MIMRAHSKQLLALGAFVALSPVAVEAAQGTFSIGRALANVSATDREAITRARTEVLQKMQPGAVSAWSDEKTGHSGEVSLRRAFEKNSMPCGDVEYVLNIPDRMVYRATFCRGGDGNWLAQG
jgi:surface antigen